MTRRILPSGDRALLVEVDGLEEVLALYPALQRSRPPGVVDLVPAARTIGVTLDPRLLPLASAAAWLERTAPDATPRDDGPAVELTVRYDGPDLAEVAALLGLDERAVIDLHTGSVWRVAFGGFAPGFGYLVTDHDRLHVPRRSTPRTAVPAGAVALAGAFSGVYPRTSPGGWQLIGTTDATLWDPSADPPALLRPGAVVRFREAR
ncbi:allophanate hydrolase subunit 1 [Leifsonia sp. F6_8S_P_1B]|uniref:Allophanate hydrolase subunit 1 n=1 Tax=Leifsonia williamsii TaxID=3035919 RepID=A0ABT8KFN2_9MICO|nr:allophanate hydrolase subunit 1 [Leifsonia williamsii]MDN4616256.1 allophanate hydrolase subunit 1 [Leifsonia williamsii]